MRLKVSSVWSQASVWRGPMSLGAHWPIRKLSLSINWAHTRSLATKSLIFLSKHQPPVLGTTSHGRDFSLRQSNASKENGRTRPTASLDARPRWNRVCPDSKSGWAANHRSFWQLLAASASLMYLQITRSWRIPKEVQLPPGFKSSGYGGLLKLHPAPGRRHQQLGTTTQPYSW